MNSVVGAQARVAVTMQGQKRYGFLVSEDVKGGTAQIRFLGPRGSSVTEVLRSDILGVFGKTFFSSLPRRPDICECVIFFDDGRPADGEARQQWRQRKGWVWDVDCDGRITLLVDTKFRLPRGKTEDEASYDDIQVEHVFEERWLEEIVLLPLGSGFRWLFDEEIEELDSKAAKESGNGSGSFSNRGNSVNPERKGGLSTSADTARLAKEASRGAEKLRELVAKVAKTQNGR